MSDYLQVRAPLPAPVDRARRSTNRSRLRTSLLGGFAALLAGALLSPAPALASDHSIIGSFSMITSVGGTVPSNGDQNPYGIVTVQRSAGSLVRGDILISNFNNAGSPPTGNLQGRGSTIVQMTPAGGLSLFAQIN